MIYTEILLETDWSYSLYNKFNLDKQTVSIFDELFV